MVIELFGLALGSRLAMAAPLRDRQSPNPASLRRPYWNLNCSNGQLYVCESRGTYCDNAWVQSNNAWCSNNCECIYAAPCGGPYCLSEGAEEDDATHGETVPEAA